MRYRIFLSSVQREFAQERRLLADYVRKVGTGTGDMLEKCRAAGAPAPEWTEEDDGFTVVLRKAKKDRVTEKVIEKITEKVTENQRAIMELLRTDSTLTQTKLSEKVGISRRHVATNIRKLMNLGRLRRVSPDKGGHWEVVG